jgi:hypothetical protein
MKQENKNGNYFFVPSIPPYSSAVVAAHGFELVHATFAKPLPVARGLKAIKAQLASRARPAQALCALELRCPAPYSFAGFNAYNEKYRALLRREGILASDPNPIARTNVAPVVAPPDEQVIHAFSYSVPATHSPAQSFVISGAGELVSSALDRSSIIRAGEVSAEALAEKIATVMGIMEKRLKAVDASWDQVTAVDVYTAHDVFPLLQRGILERAGAASRLGIHWFLSRPPVTDIEFEMDLRGVATEEICYAGAQDAP